MKTGSLMLMIRTRSSAAVVVAAFALASCATASPETKASGASPSSETAQEGVATQMLDRIDDAPITKAAPAASTTADRGPAPNDPSRHPTDPDTVPPEHKKSFQSIHRFALDGRDYELQVSGLQWDGAHHPLACNLEGPDSGGEALKCEVAGRYDGITSLFEGPFHDRPQFGNADADGGHASLADGLMPDESATLAEDEQDRLLKLHIYESKETGDLRLIWSEGAGLAFQWKLKLQRE